jgi:hypothetical protein
MRVLAFSTLLTIGIVASAQTVSYKSTGASVAKVVAAIAAQTGEKLAVDKEIASEIVVVLVRDLDPRVFREKLADCVSGKWVRKDDGTLELRVDGALSSTRRKAAQKSFADGVPAKIQSTRTIYARHRTDPAYTDWATSSQLAMDIFETVPHSVFESLLPQSRVVLSTHPNRSQLHLKDISELVEKRKPGTSANIAEASLAINRGDHNDHVLSELRIKEESGLEHSSWFALVELDTGAPPSQPGKAIQWSEASLELARNYRSWGRRAEVGLLSISTHLREVLSKPTQVDPLSFEFGEGMVAVAEEKGENLVACAADDDWFQYARQGATTGDFWSVIMRRRTLISTRKDGWITVRPADPIEARRLRGDRVAFEKLITTATKQGRATSDDLAAFAVSNLSRTAIPRAFSYPFQTMVNYYADPGEGGWVSGNLRPLQFYASVPLSQRTELKSGTALPVARLTPTAKKVLEAVFFEPQPSAPGALSIEPTEAMPEGVPLDLLVKAAAIESPLIYPLPDAGEATMPTRGKSPAAIAQEKWQRTHDDNPYAQDMPELNRVLLGERTRWQFDIGVPNKLYVSLIVADDRLPKAAKPTTMDELSADLKATLDRAYKEFLKAMGGGG